MGFPTGAELCIHQGNKHLLRRSIRTLAKHHCTHLKTNPVSETELWERLGGDYSISMEETTEVGLQKGLTDSVYMKLIDTRVDEFLTHTEECGACEYAKICAGGCRASALCYDKTDIMAPDRAACLIFREGYGKRLEEVLKEMHIDREGVL